MFKKDGVDLNIAILMDICDGNIFKLYRMATKYDKIHLYISLRYVENLIIDNFVSAGMSQKSIQNALRIHRKRFERAKRRNRNAR